MALVSIHFSQWGNVAIKSARKVLLSVMEFERREAPASFPLDDLLLGEHLSNTWLLPALLPAPKAIPLAATAPPETALASPNSAKFDGQDVSPAVGVNSTPGFESMGGPYEPTYQTYEFRQVYMGKDSPIPEQTGEQAYRDEKAYSLLGQINGTPDVVGEGAGYHVIGAIPQVGTYYEPGYPGTYVERPLTISYTSTGADIAVIDPGSDEWTYSYGNNFTVSGTYAEIMDQHRWAYLVPDHDESVVTVSATSEDDVIHTTNQIVTSVEAVSSTLSMTVPTPAYEDPTLVERRQSLLALEPIADNPPAPAPAGNVKDGIKWNTLKLLKANETLPYPGVSIKADIYEVFTVNDKVVKLVETKRP